MRKALKIEVSVKATTEHDRYNRNACSAKGLRRMAYSVSFIDLQNMPPAEKDRALGSLVAGARASVNGQTDKLEAEIREYERRYEVSSERMMEQLAEGERKETAEIASWLMRLRIRERMRDAEAG
jgi:hypothetical protein